MELNTDTGKCRKKCTKKQERVGHKQRCRLKKEHRKSSKKKSSKKKSSKKKASSKKGSKKKRGPKKGSKKKPGPKKGSKKKPGPKKGSKKKAASKQGELTLEQQLAKRLNEQFRKKKQFNLDVLAKQEQENHAMRMSAL